MIGGERVRCAGQGGRIPAGVVKNRAPAGVVRKSKRSRTGVYRSSIGPSSRRVRELTKGYESDFPFLLAGMMVDNMSARLDEKGV